MLPPPPFSIHRFPAPRPLDSPTRRRWAAVVGGLGRDRSVHVSLQLSYVPLCASSDLSSWCLNLQRCLAVSRSAFIDSWSFMCSALVQRLPALSCVTNQLVKLIVVMCTIVQRLPAPHANATRTVAIKVFALWRAGDLGIGWFWPRHGRVGPSQYQFGTL